MKRKSKIEMLKEHFSCHS